MNKIGCIWSTSDDEDDVEDNHKDDDKYESNDDNTLSIEVDMPIGYVVMKIHSSCKMSTCPVGGSWGFSKVVATFNHVGGFL